MPILILSATENLLLANNLFLYIGKNPFSLVLEFIIIVDGSLAVLRIGSDINHATCKFHNFLLIFIILTVLFSVFWTALAQKFARTCRKNEGIVKHARSAETCDDCTVQCGKKCPGGTFLLEQRFCKKEPCPWPNPLLKKGVCLVRSHHKSNVVCFCCCVDKFITE
ncbi:hypothetical protein MKW92_044192 [Papaver armeniacum]|nr:hypothetical protein MKW92_044192 [Papaver armeniacum]